MKLSKKMIEVDERVKYGFNQYFRIGVKFLGSTEMADQLIGDTAEARKSQAWLVCERMMYAKITEHTFRVHNNRIVEIDGRK